MRENIQRVAERGERLDALQDKTCVSLVIIWSLRPCTPVYLRSLSDGCSLACLSILLKLTYLPVCFPTTHLARSDNLAVSAQGFRRGANKVRKAMWWKDTKMKIIIGVGVAVLMCV